MRLVLWSPLCPLVGRQAPRLGVGGGAGGGSRRRVRRVRVQGVVVGGQWLAGWRGRPPRPGARRWRRHGLGRGLCGCPGGGRAGTGAGPRPGRSCALLRRPGGKLCLTRSASPRSRDSPGATFYSPGPPRWRERVCLVQQGERSLAEDRAADGFGNGAGPPRHGRRASMSAGTPRPAWLPLSYVRGRRPEAQPCRRGRLRRGTGPGA